MSKFNGSLESDDPKNLVEQEDEGWHDYPKSLAFAEDLLRTFTAASRRAREEHERLGHLPTEHRQQN